MCLCTLSVRLLVKGHYQPSRRLLAAPVWIGGWSESDDSRRRLDNQR